MPNNDESEAIELRLFLDGIHARYGYDLRGYAEASMSRRVHAVLARSGLPHLGELQHRVLTDPAFFALVLNDLTVQVSELFRDPTFYRTVRTRVVPILRTYPLLKIWHAGCASGEEAYAMAILLQEEGLYERAQIYATDLSPDALDQAKQGVYPEDKLGLFTANHASSGGRVELASHCTAAYGGVAIKESLRRNILFFQHDLVSDHPFGEMHVIFCRNVLIYFDAPLRQRVIDKFAASLCPGGFFCLGSSERLRRSDALSRFREFDGDARIYRHEADA